MPKDILSLLGILLVLLLVLCGCYLFTRWAEAGLEHVIRLLVHHAAHYPQHYQRPQEGGYRHHVLAHHDVAFFSFVTPLFWGRFFGLGIAGHRLIPPFLESA